jgi:malate dehydrogenase (oxaloacetate-decarboxylating)
LQDKDIVSGWRLEHPDKISLLDIVRNAKPTMLIGTSGQAGAFSESVVRAMAENNERPIILPLSNPTSRAEATPADIDAWTGGRAIIGTGSPFPPLLHNGRLFKVDQTNNSYIFPGVGLGAIAVGAERISDQMFMAAAQALAGKSPARGNPSGNLLPPVSALRDVAATVAVAVAIQGNKEGLVKNIRDDEIEERVRAKVWTPRYAAYRRSHKRVS